MWCFAYLRAVAGVGWRLTIHSSRSRFAARLNSGVRPLQSIRFHPAACLRTPLSSPTDFCGFRSCSFTFSNPCWPRLAVALDASRGSKLTAGSSLCPSVSGGSFDGRPFPSALGREKRLRQEASVRFAPDRRQSDTLRPNTSFKPKPLRGSA